MTALSLVPCMVVGYICSLKISLVGVMRLKLFGMKCSIMGCDGSCLKVSLSQKCAICTKVTCGCAGMQISGLRLTMGSVPWLSAVLTMNSQWHQVRTPQFKAWFGDRESAGRLSSEPGLTQGKNTAPPAHFNDITRRFIVQAGDEISKAVDPETSESMFSA